MKKIKVLKNLRLVLWAAILPFLITSCNNDFTSKEDREITSFKLETSKNKSLNKDYEGIIDGQYIEVVINRPNDDQIRSNDHEILKELVATVKYTGKRIKPDDGSAIDYTQLVTYAVQSDEAEDNVTVYVVDIHFSDESSREEESNDIISEANDEEEEEPAAVEEETKEETKEPNTTVDDDTGIARPGIESTKPIVLGYLGSWKDQAQGNIIRQIPEHITHIFYGFVRPDVKYEKGSYNLTLTSSGIESAYLTDTPRFLESIKSLSDRGIKVILSVGGQTYWNSPEQYQPNYQSLKDIVDDYGFAGIDWDFEPSGSFSTIGNAENVQHMIDFIRESRKIMPKGEYIIACAPAGIGAIGGTVNDDPSSPYSYNNRGIQTGESDANINNATSSSVKAISYYGFGSAGHMLPVLKAVGSDIDIVAYQAYNTGAATNRKYLYDSWVYYADIYGFEIAHGVHYPDEPWGPYYEYTHENIAELSEHIYKKGQENPKRNKDGVMIWEILMGNKALGSTAYSYMNVASKVLNGMSPATAVAQANDYVTYKYDGGSAVTVTATGGASAGPLHCNVPEWSSEQQYATAGTKVYYDGYIWKNNWWTQGDTPEDIQYGGPWKKVTPCDE